MHSHYSSTHETNNCDFFTSNGYPSALMILMFVSLLTIISHNNFFAKPLINTLYSSSLGQSFSGGRWMSRRNCHGNTKRRKRKGWGEGDFIRIHSAPSSCSLQFLSKLSSNSSHLSFAHFCRTLHILSWRNFWWLANASTRDNLKVPSWRFFPFFVYNFAIVHL